MVAVVPVTDYCVRPYTDNCARLLDIGQHALIGLSMWNSYFTPRRVAALIGWAARTFDRIDVFIPGYESAYTLIAAGHPPVQAVRSARRAVVKLRVPALRALARAGPGEAHLHTTTTLTNRSRYVQLRRLVHAAYRDDPAIRAVCQNCARTAIGTHSAADPGPSQLDMAVRYAVAEFPLFVDSPGIFAVPSSVVLYHRHIPLTDPLIAGTARAVALSPTQGFAIATIGDLSDGDRS